MPSGSPGRAPFLTGLTVSSEETGTSEAKLPDDTPPNRTSDRILSRRRRVTIGPLAAETEFPFVTALNEILPTIAETYGINLVADAYRGQCVPMPPLATGEEWSIDELLNQYVRPSAHCIMVGSFLSVRRQTWYRDRLAEIPDRLIRHWSAYLRTQRQLSVGDAAKLSLALRDEQLESFEAVMREEGIRLSGIRSEWQPFRQEVVGNKEILRAYGSLTPTQQRCLQAGGVVSYAAMSPAARRWVDAAVNQRRRLPLDPVERQRCESDIFGTAGAAPVTLLLSYAMIPGSEQCEFRLQDDERGTQLLFSLRLPRIDAAPPRG